MCDYLVFFFFKQKTAYEMRISDWTSDVCSSDLGIDIDRLDRQPAGTADQGGAAGRRAEVDRTGAQELERLVGAEREHPTDLGAVGGELLFEPALVLQQDGDGIVVGPVDADGLGRLFGGEGKIGRAHV